MEREGGSLGGGGLGVAGEGRHGEEMCRPRQPLAVRPQPQRVAQQHRIHEGARDVWVSHLEGLVAENFTQLVVGVECSHRLTLPACKQAGPEGGRAVGTSRPGRVGLKANWYGTGRKLRLKEWDGRNKTRYG